MILARRLVAQRALAMLLCAAALLLKLLVPSGYMVGEAHGRVTIELCSGIAGQPMAMAMPSMHDEVAGHGKSRDHGKAEMPCAFSGLAAASLGAIDPVQLAAPILFVVAAGMVPSAPHAAPHPSYLRPPLRGPPAIL